MRESLLSFADAMAGMDKVRAKAAKAAMAQAVHAACVPGSDKALRAALLKELSLILSSSRPRLVRAHATALLGFIGSKADDKALARLTADPELKEDTRMARERLRRSG